MVLGDGAEFNRHIQKHVLVLLYSLFLLVLGLTGLFFTSVSSLKAAVRIWKLRDESNVEALCFQVARPYVGPILVKAKAQKHLDGFFSQFDVEQTN